MSTTSTMTSPKVIIGIQKRRKWSEEMKMSLIEETFKPGQSVSSVARQNGISPSQLFYWRRCMENGAATAVRAEDEVVSETEFKKALARIRDLERALGKATLQNEILKEAVRIGREKKLISRSPLLGMEDFQ